MAIIALDIDGVCYDFVSALRDYISQETGRPANTFPEAVDWNFFSTSWGYTYEQYVDFMIQGFKDRKVFWSGSILPGCKEAVEEIKSQGHYIKYITARSFEGIHELAEEATSHWINEVGLPYDEIIVCNDKTTQAYDVLFDDAPHNIEAALLHGRNAYLFSRPWNTKNIDLPRVYGWEGVVNYVGKNF